MIDLIAKSPVEGCTEFAMQLLKELYFYDLAAIDNLIDVADFPVDESFPKMTTGNYGNPDEIADWHFSVESRDNESFSCRFEIPFPGTKYRPMIAEFIMTRVRDSLSVRLVQVSPS